MRFLLFWLKSLSGFHFLQDKAYSPQDGKPGPSEPASAPPLISLFPCTPKDLGFPIKDTLSYLSFTLCFCCCCFVFSFPWMTFLLLTFPSSQESGRYCFLQDFFLRLPVWASGLFFQCSSKYPVCNDLLIRYIQLDEKLCGRRDCVCFTYPSILSA